MEAHKSGADARMRGCWNWFLVTAAAWPIMEIVSAGESTHAARNRFMQHPSAIRKVAFPGDYLPRKCGIPAFTTDLRCAVAVEFTAMQCLVVPVNDLAGGYEYPAEVRFEIAEQELPSYLRSADFLNITEVDVVCVEHEFGIFGGPAGSHVPELLHYTCGALLHGRELNHSLRHERLCHRFTG